MAKSYRDLLKDGILKRADALKVRLQDIHEEDGFNLRDETAIDPETGETFEQSIASLADYIADGGKVPPLEIRPREEGGVLVVDGHRRRRAFKKLLDEGRAVVDKDGDLWISVVSFEGNDVKRTARILTSGDNRKLSDLERARGYARLHAWGLSSAEIAQEVKRSRAHVEQLLILWNANRDVHDMVRAGKVTTTGAIEMARKHGEKAGAVIAGKLKAKGGGKLKQSDVRGKSLPRKLVDEVADRIAFVDSALNQEQRKALALAEKDPQRAGELVTIEAGTLLEVIQAARLIQEERERQKNREAAKAEAAKQKTIEGAGEE
ncbi:TPA: ParB N-terminal domain-containing protein [Burkholderia vietnamiensis]|nr:ParB N-terminal domain-containing protein [Burkholderia vietnamiensis]